MLIDTHCHINFKDFKEDADEVIKKSLENGVQLICVGVEYETSQRAVEYANKYDEGVWVAVGLHPMYVKSNHKIESIKHKEEIFNYEKYLELAKNKKVVAIGEIGLDYHHFDDNSNLQMNASVKEIKKKQKDVLQEFIKLANEVKKPLVLHCWDAYDDLLKILKKNSVKKCGVVHSFVGSWKTAQKFINLGYKIGLNGIITYSESYDKLIKNIDLKNILIETDCPYLSPKPLERDSRNEPENVKYIAQKIAEVKEIKIDEVEKVTTINAKKLFRI